MNLSAGFLQIPIDPGSKKGGQVLGEERIEQLCREIGLKFGARDSRTSPVHILLEALHDSFGTRPAFVESDPQIEEIAAFPPLIERPQLGPQELIEAERRDEGFSREPEGVDLKPVPLQGAYRKMFS